MGNLANQIEEYLKHILAQTDAGYIVLQRGSLAETFSCAPSQINYVLTTRFTVEKGYLVESRRGGGGYLRIVRLGLSVEGPWQEVMRQLIGNQLSQDRAFSLIERLYNEELLTGREAALLKSVLAKESLGVKPPEDDIMRARLMNQILITICREDIE